MDNDAIIQRLKRLSNARRSQGDRDALAKAIELIEALRTMREDVLSMAQFPEENGERLAEALVKLLELEGAVVTANGERQLTSVPQV